MDFACLLDTECIGNNRGVALRVRAQVQYRTGCCPGELPSEYLCRADSTQLLPHPTLVVVSHLDIDVLALEQVIFIVYPSVCNQAFSMFNCRELDGGTRILLLDYSIECNTSTHLSFQAVAIVVVVVFSFGVPLYLIVLMVKRMQEYHTGAESADRFVARRVADELHIDDAAATDAIRDVSTGREY